MTLDEYNSLYEKLLKTKITETNLLEFHKFTRFSPERFSKRLGIDELEFIKKCNSDKKEIHNKILGWKRIKKLKGYNPKPKQFNRQVWDRSKKENVSLNYNYRLCICVKYCRINYSWRTNRKYRFYEDMKYLYCQDPTNSNNIIIVNDRDEEFTIRLEEFNNSFNDYRDQILNDLLN